MAENTEVLQGRQTIGRNGSLSFKLYMPRLSIPTFFRPVIVVFLNGLLTHMSAWDGVAREICGSNPAVVVITYDRWNTGDSDPLPASRNGVNDIDGSISDLLALLENIGKVYGNGVRQGHQSNGWDGAPLVLVGHSMGGCIARAFASRYPCHGLMLMDEYMADTDFVSLFPGQVDGERDTLKTTRKIILERFGLGVVNGEDFDWRSTMELLPSPYEPKLLGDPHLIVLAHDPEFNVDNLVEHIGIDKRVYLECVQVAWDRYNKGLLSLCSYSEKVIAKGASHLINKDRPDLIRTQTLRLCRLEKPRRGASASPPQ